MTPVLRAARMPNAIARTADVQRQEKVSAHVAAIVRRPHAPNPRRFARFVLASPVSSRRKENSGVNIVTVIRLQGSRFVRQPKKHIERYANA